MILSPRRPTWCLPPSLASCLASSLALGLLVACGGHNEPVNPPSTGGAPRSSNAALFDPTTATIPLPNILATATASDPLAGRAANSPMTPPEALAYINQHEVGGTQAVSGLNAPIYLRFSYPVDATTVTPAHIKVFQITADAAGTENAPLGFSDISGMFTYQYAAGSTDLLLFPRFPLTPGARYLYVVTSRVKDADTQGSVIPSVYFNALKATTPLTGSLLPLEAIRANTLVTGTTQIKLSGYAKVMDDLIASAATTTIGSRDDIALMGRFITTGAGFISADASSAEAASASRIPVETALRYFAGGAFGKTWNNAALLDALFDRGGEHPSPDAYWSQIPGAGTTAPASVGTIVLGRISSAQLSIDPVVAGAHATEMDLSAVTGAYNPAAGVVQAFRAGASLAGFRHSTLDGRGGQVPFLYLAPAGTPPEGGWPLVIFQHGITSQKESAVALAQSLTAQGFALIAIDLPMHGALAAPGHGTGEAWASDFLALGAPLATRSNIQQAAFHLNRLEFVVASGGLDSLGAFAPSRTRIQFVGHSLGSIVGAYYLAGNTKLSAADVLDTNMRGFLSVPGARTAYLIGDSPTFGPAVLQGLEGAGIVPGTPTFHQFFLVTQSVVDSVDPATMTTPMKAGLPSRLSGRLAIQEVIDDQVIGNAYTRYLGNALGGRGVLGAAGASVAPGFNQLGYQINFEDPGKPLILAPFMFTLNGTAPVPKADFAAAMPATGLTSPSEGYFQFGPQGFSHTFLLRPDAHNPSSIQAAQTQLLFFLGITGHSVIVDPTTIVGATAAQAPALDVIQVPKRFAVLGR